MLCDHMDPDSVPVWSAPMCYRKNVKNLRVPHNTASLFHKDIGRPTEYSVISNTLKILLMHAV